MTSDAGERAPPEQRGGGDEQPEGRGRRAGDAEHDGDEQQGRGDARAEAGTAGVDAGRVRPSAAICRSVLGSDMMPPEDLIELDAHGVRVRGPAEPGSHDAVGIEQQGGRGLRDVELAREIGATGQVDLDVPCAGSVTGDPLEQPRRREDLGPNSVENCTMVAASPKTTAPSSVGLTRSPEPARARPCRDCQSSPIAVATATSPAPVASAASQSMVRA